MARRFRRSGHEQGSGFEARPLWDLLVPIP